MSKNDAATIANLNRLLEVERAKAEEQSATIEELQGKVEEQERLLDIDDASMWRPRAWTEDGLPVPRIELRWKVTGHSEATALLVLVYRHVLTHIEGVVLGQTRCSGGSYDRERLDGKPPFHAYHGDGLETPFRDGVHMTHNTKQLGLRAFITTESGDATEIDPETRAQTWIRCAEETAK